MSSATSPGPALLELLDEVVEEGTVDSLGALAATAAQQHQATPSALTVDPAASIGSIASPMYLLVPTPGGPATFSPGSLAIGRSGAGHLFDPTPVPAAPPPLHPDPAAGGLDNGHMYGAAGLAALREADPGVLGPLGPLGPLAGASGPSLDAPLPVHPEVLLSETQRANSAAAAQERFTTLKNSPKPCCQRVRPP